MDIPPEIPVYAYIKRELKNQIESGELAEGDRVPSEYELARMYSVSRNPTRQALRDLELEGYITRSPGRGSFVAPVADRKKLFNGNNWRALAIACPELECHYNRTVIQAFVETAQKHGYYTMVYFPRFTEEAEFEFLADIRNSGVIGLGVWIQHASERTVGLLRKFRRASFPFVLIDRFVRGLDADAVVTDNFDASYQLTKALVDRGHRDIGMISTELDNTSAEDRYAGYRKAIEDAGIPFTEELVGFFDDAGPAPETVVNRIMAHRRRPTAFFCNNDGCALKLMDEFDKLGYTVGKPAEGELGAEPNGEVELALVDDNDVAGALEVPMLTAAQAGAAMGRRSAELLVDRAKEPNAPGHQVFLRAHFHGLTPSPSESGKV